VETEEDGEPDDKSSETTKLEAEASEGKEELEANFVEDRLETDTEEEVGRDVESKAGGGR
jgi:hypothetical protein